MKVLHASWSAAIFLALLGVRPAYGADALCPGGAREGEFIIQLKESAAASARSSELLERSGFKALGPEMAFAAPRTFVARAESPRIVRSEDIESIEPNCIVRKRAQLLPNDQYLRYQWGLHNDGQDGGSADVDIDAPEAWSVITDASAVVVAVVDSGLDISHPDIRDNVWVNDAEARGAAGADDDADGYVDNVYGYNAAGNNGDVTDRDGHGTLNAGIIGAGGNNGAGIPGVAWRVKLMAVRVFDGGTSDNATLLRAFDYVVALKKRGVNIRVLNASLGGTGPCLPSYLRALTALNEAGVLVSTAAGNEAVNNDDIPSFPANCPVSNILSVTSVDRRGRLPAWANTGPASVHLAAPGDDVWGPQPFNVQPEVFGPGNGYASGSGTSFAAPFVSGVAALAFARKPELSPGEMRDVLLNSVRPLPSLSGKILAPGMINAFSVLKALPGAPAVNDPVPGVTLLAPAKVSASDGKSRRYVSISWRKVRGAKRYEIFRSQAAGELGRRLASVKGNSFKDRSAKRGRTYYYTVRAVNGVSISALSRQNPGRLR